MSKSSQTEKNLLISSAGEPQARNRYTYFAAAARREGLIQISHIFWETANQEKEHAKRFFKSLEGGKLDIMETFSAGVIGSTLENLRDTAASEEHEWAEMYPGFAATAREEVSKILLWHLKQSPLQKSSTVNAIEIWQII